MAALAIRVRAQLRTRWRAWLLLALLTGVLGGLVIAAAAGARRTASSYTHYLGSINGADVYVDPFVTEHGDTIPLDRVASLPQVVQTERSFQPPVLVRTRAGRPAMPIGPDSVSWVLPTDDRARDAIDELKLLRGRFPDPSRPDEVIGDTSALANLGVHVGDKVVVRLIRQHMIDTGVFHFRSDPLKTHTGPLATVRVVGVAANARADVDGGQMHLTPAFFHRYGERKIGSFIEELEIRLRHGQADLPAFKRELARVAGKRPFLLFEPSAGHPKIQHSIDLQARALWLIAALTALATLVIAGQALLRVADEESGEDPTLRALGAGSGHQIGFSLVRGTLIAVPAAIVAVGVAYTLSLLMPIGWARELEPDLGLDFDAAAIAIGAAAIAGLCLVVSLVAAVRSLLSGQRRRLPVVQEAPIGARLIRRVTSPAAAAGIGMAFGRGDRRAARGTFAAAVVAVAVCVVAMTFAASFARLKDTPRLYGQTWDYETFGGPPPPKKQMASILHDRGLPQVAAGADSTLTMNGVDTGVRAWDDLKGTIDPTLTAGRRPRGPDEVALGSKTMDQAHAHLGGLVLVGSGARVRRMHVVGRVVLPSSKTNKLGYGGVMSFAALHRVDRGAQRGLLLIGVADSRAGATAERRLDDIFDANIVVRPDEVGDFGRIDNMPLYIALLAICAAAAALAHALVSRVRRGRRELAVLKTLGFTRPQVAATIAWQATTILVVAVVLGVPLGAAAGRFTWDLFARDLGVAPDVVVPIVPVLLLVPATVLAGNLLAAVPAWLGARIRPAPVLRTE